MAAELGRTLVSWRATAAEPTDEGYLYGYEIDLGSADGRVERRLVFVDDTESFEDHPESVHVPANGRDAAVTVWVYPNDPALPALRSLVDLDSTELVLASLGVAVRPTASEVVAYRPNRRAVVRVDSAVGHTYLKVVEPPKAEGIAERHAQFRLNALPVPRLLGWSPEGVIALSELVGVDAQTAIADIRDRELFLDQVEILTSLLADVPAFSTARESLIGRLDWYIKRLWRRLPDERGRIEVVGEAIARAGADARTVDFPTVTVHGDLHVGQLFVDPEHDYAITGMLDIDTAGAGDPADDAAALYAHLVALGELGSGRDAEYAQACWDIASRWLTRWHRNSSPGFAARARAIAATHLLGHALRPLTRDARSSSMRLLECAERLVEGA